MLVVFSKHGRDSKQWELRQVSEFLHEKNLKEKAASAECVVFWRLNLSRL